MSSLTLDFTFSPDDIVGEYRPAYNGGNVMPSESEQFSLSHVVLRVERGGREITRDIPAYMLDDVTLKEIEHFKLACRREEREAAEYEERCLRRAV